MQHKLKCRACRTRWDLPADAKNAASDIKGCRYRKCDYADRNIQWLINMAGDVTPTHEITPVRDPHGPQPIFGDLSVRTIH